MASTLFCPMSWRARSIRACRSGLVKGRAWPERLESAAMAGGTWPPDGVCAARPDGACAARSGTVHATAADAARKLRREMREERGMVLRGECEMIADSRLSPGAAGVL